MRLSILLLMAVGITACSGPTACAPTTPCTALRSTADSLAGLWKEAQAWRGVAAQMSLTARDSTLDGSGTYSDSNGTIGTINMTGFVFWQDSAVVPAGYIVPAHPVVVLDIAFSNGMFAVFDQGVIEQQNTLTGVLTFSDDSSASYVTTFVRTAP